MKRWRLWLALVIVLMVAGFGLYTAYSWYLQFPVRRPSVAQTVSPVRMDLRREVPAFGQVVAPTPVPADFDVGGTVAVVHVARGDSVAAGDLMAELEREPLQLAVASAEAGVRAAQAQIDRLRRTPSDEDIAALEAGVEVARSGVQTAAALVAGANANLTAATAGSGPEELAIAAKRIEDAKASLWGAQAHRDALCGRVGKGVSEADCDNAEAAVAHAQQAVDIAELQLQQLQAGPRPEDVAPYRAQVQQSQSNLETARAQLKQAEAAVAKALQPTLPEEIAAAQAALDQAESALTRTQQQLEQAELTAPIGGVLTAVEMAPGKTVNAGQMVAQISDVSLLDMMVLVNERFVGEVQAGQPCRARLEAYPDVWLSGTVTAVAPLRQSTSAGANYEVTLHVDAGAVTLREGMAVEARIETGHSPQALAVPREVLRLGPEGRYVERLTGGSGSEQVVVATGLVEGRYVEVLSGLTEDDDLLIAGTSLGTERGDYRWLPFGIFWRVN